MRVYIELQRTSKSSVLSNKRHDIRPENMKLTYLTSALLALTPALALPSPTLNSLTKKADSTKVGYLAVYWTTEDESVYFSLSSNDDPLNFQSLNGGNAIVSPTLGTKAIRDTSIIEGKGADEGKYYIIGTDLDIDTVCPYLSSLLLFC
jgi:hypothetical protein